MEYEVCLTITGAETGQLQLRILPRAVTDVITIFVQQHAYSRDSLLARRSDSHSCGSNSHIQKERQELASVLLFPQGG